MKKNFKLTLEYDGAGYQGWQRQKNGPTVQGALENALARMTGQSLSLIGSGRTDSGVHALGQVANFICETRLGPREFQNGLNSLLQPDIAVVDCAAVPLDFHARFDAKGKLYAYHLLNRPIRVPVGRQYHWHIKPALDIQAMRSALAYIRGRHDFKAFEGAGSPRSHTVRTVVHAELIPCGDRMYRFEIEADGFLRYMVRNIVGTLVELGKGKISPREFNAILGSRNRDRAGPTAPAQGLFLVRVFYEEEGKP